MTRLQYEKEEINGNLGKISPNRIIELIKEGKTEAEIKALAIIHFTSFRY